ncbi:SMP-30/gluconolactonase/LRE family protein [Aquabacterium sp. A7-Y]|uniref:SMP-30/gluconolactonase/LRE family protein n=1 Tax=Aquabacterium sp. A7-Y TaxID=1349605 RepID=UPI00223CB875|nr:SMP-30/gluconolactonase/LRE family protein [Aquabacterium sp. A7-Y]MCW7538369.1 SMP-30/gluconolactonase/LRE family protein [Aquabacterium sp. A7-Y]
MRRGLLTFAGVAAAATAYLLGWPVPADPVAWQPPPTPGYAGPHAVNDRLTRLQHLDLGSEVGPEHVVARPDGWLYVAVASGKILRLRPDGSAREVVVNTGGRPLGFDFDAEGALVIADPLYGEHGALLKAGGSGPSARLQVLADRVDGDPLRYVDAVVVARDGKIYFTDASRRFGPKQWGGTFPASVLDILEHQSTGRLLEHDPATGRTRVLVAGLCFPNGLALSQDGSHLFLNETGEYRVWKVSVQADRLDARQLAAGSPQAQVLLSNLPGYPDNLMRGRDGRLWVGLAKPRGAFIDNNAQRPWLRRLALRLPKALWPVPPAYGHVFAFDESGRVLADLQDPSGVYPETTAVTETEDRLYIQSLHAKTLGWLDRKSAGL